MDADKRELDELYWLLCMETHDQSVTQYDREMSLKGSLWHDRQTNVVALQAAEVRIRRRG